MEDVPDLLLSLRNKGIKIWTYDRKLHYQAPPGALSASDIESLRASKLKIIEFLTDQSTYVQRRVCPRDASQRVPLAFAQHFFWNPISRNGGWSLRARFLVLRLVGPLNMVALESALTELVRRHEILRTNIVAERDGPRQMVGTPPAIRLETISLTDLTVGEREQGAMRAINELAGTRINASVDPLFKPGLVLLGGEESIFFVLMDHIICDAKSISILLNDLGTLYVDAVYQRPFSLVELSSQFADYAVCQCRHDDAHARLAGARSLKVFRDGSKGNNLSDQGDYTFNLDTSSVTNLRRFCAAQGTTLMLGLLATYVAVLSKWCDATDVTISIAAQRFHNPETENAIGLFTRLLFLRIVVSDSDSFGELFNRVVQQYGSICDGDDSQELAVQMQGQEFVSNPMFNFFSNQVEEDNPGGAFAMLSEVGLTASHVSVGFDIPASYLDYHLGTTEFMLTLGESQAEVFAWLSYRTNLATEPGGVRFANDMQTYARMLAEAPGMALCDLANRSFSYFPAQK